LRFATHRARRLERVRQQITKIAIHCKRKGRATARALQAGVFGATGLVDLCWKMNRAVPHSETTAIIPF
jgi:hypothetical protein